MCPSDPAVVLHGAEARESGIRNSPIQHGFHEQMKMNEFVLTIGIRPGFDPHPECVGSSSLASPYRLVCTYCVHGYINPNTRRRRKHDICKSSCRHLY